MDIHVFSKPEIEEGIVIQSSYIVISITDSDDAPAKIIKGSGFVDALYLEFDDTDPEFSFGCRPMQIGQATVIWNFVQGYLDEVEAVVCHCLAGMSRSPAVALALAEALGEDTAHFAENFNYNTHVYDTMRKAIRLDEL